MENGKVSYQLNYETFQPVPGSIPGGGDFLMSGIRVFATDQGPFFTSKNPEQSRSLKFYSRTGPDF